MMQLQIVTPNGEEIIDDVNSVSIPGGNGTFTVLPGHAPLLSTLTEEKIIYKQNGTEKSIMPNFGIVEVKQNIIKILSPCVK